MLKTMDPRLLLGDRYSLLYYTCLVTLYLSGNQDQFSRRYAAMMAHFPGEAHEHSPDKFAALIETIRAEGYRNDYPVLANPQNFFLVNGEHRCAIAIALGIERIPYSLVFKTDEVARSFFHEKLLPPEDIRELDNYLETLLATFPADLSKTIRMRRLIRSHDAHFRDAPWASNTVFASARTYQGIGHLCGKRNTEERWREYGLEPFLRSSDEALEIGCNVGFFTSLLGQQVKHVDAFDIDPVYIQVAKAYNESSSTHFHVARFEDLQTDKRYDVIVCCAVHGWVSVGFGDFLIKLFDILKPEGLILFESHEILCEREWLPRRALIEATCEILHRGHIDDVDHSLYTSEIREHMILRPRARGQELDDILRRHGFAVSHSKPQPKAQVPAATTFAVKVSIVLPTYNHAQYLPAAVQSILAQTYQDFELIIVDDGSTDETPALLARIQHPRIRIITKENGKLPAALNTGFEAARGEYFTWTSADNIVAPAWLEELVAALDSSPSSVGYALSHYATIDDAGRITAVCDDQCFETHRLLSKNGNASFLYRSELARRAGGYDPALLGAEDLDLWLRMSTITRAVLVESVLYYYRVHDASMTAQIPTKIDEATRRTYRKFLDAHGGKLNVDRLFPNIRSSTDPAVARWQARVWLTGCLAVNLAWPVETLVDLLSQCLKEQYTPGLVGNVVHLYAMRDAWTEAAAFVTRFAADDMSDYMRTLQNIVARQDRAMLQTIPFISFSEQALKFNPHSQLSRSASSRAIAA